MSSGAVRTKFDTFLKAQFPAETFIDLSGEYSDLETLIEAAGITRADTWIGVQYIGSEEVPVCTTSTNTSGTYRERGALYLHIVEVAQLGVAGLILTRAEAIRARLRGQNIDNIIIESVTPPNFELGTTLEFEGGYVSASVVIQYHYDINL